MRHTIILFIGVIITGFIAANNYNYAARIITASTINESFLNDPLKQDVLKILDQNCNACHRRQNPFMVFNERNVSKRSRRIYQAVFIDKRMPKGDQFTLTQQEYKKLKQWISNQIEL